MTNEECAFINHDVLGAWEEILNKEHCTPALIVAIAHDEKCGQIHIVHREGTPSFAMIRFLETALEKLRAGN